MHVFKCDMIFCSFVAVVIILNEQSTPCGSFAIWFIFLWSSITVHCIGLVRKTGHFGNAVSVRNNVWAMRKQDFAKKRIYIDVWKGPRNACVKGCSHYTRIRDLYMLRICERRRYFHWVPLRDARDVRVVWRVLYGSFTSRIRCIVLRCCLRCYEATGDLWCRTAL